jgi:hypothetical protein
MLAGVQTACMCNAPQKHQRAPAVHVQQLACDRAQPVRCVLYTSSGTLGSITSNSNYLQRRSMYDARPSTNEASTHTTPHAHPYMTSCLRGATWRQVCPPVRCALYNTINHMHTRVTLAPCKVKTALRSVSVVQSLRLIRS